MYKTPFVRSKKASSVPLSSMSNIILLKRNQARNELIRHATAVMTTTRFRQCSSMGELLASLLTQVF